MTRRQLLIILFIASACRGDPSPLGSNQPRDTLRMSSRPAPEFHDFLRKAPAPLPEEPPRIDMSDSAAASIVRYVTTYFGQHGFPTWLGRVMRQERRSHSRRRLDSIADGLASFAIRSSRTKTDSAWRTVVNAVLAISQSGHASGPAFVYPVPYAQPAATYLGVPYAGALDRLIRIYKEADGNIRGPVIRQLLTVPGYSRAIQYLRGVATENNSFAYTAVDELWGAAIEGVTASKTGPGYPAITEAQRAEAYAALNQLFLSRGVKYFLAKETMTRVAHNFGWRCVTIPASDCTIPWQ